MDGGLRMSRPIHYIKPNMANLHGRSGRKIFNIIKNTKTDPKQIRRLEKEVEQFKKNILAQMANEKK